MASYNRIVLVGNLTRDPELKYTTAGTAMCKFGIATSRKFKRKDGQESEDVMFITCTAWGKLADIVQKYLKKGSQTLVEGRLTFSTWEKDGRKHSKHEVNAENVMFLGRPKGQAESESPPASREEEESSEITEAGSNDVEEDEVPF